jgi:hypothetical protein
VMSEKRTPLRPVSSPATITINADIQYFKPSLILVCQLASLWTPLSVLGRPRTTVGGSTYFNLNL